MVVLKNLRFFLWSFLMPRHLKKTVISTICFGILCALWFWSRQTPYNYAVTCKSRIADIVLPSTADKKAYLLNLARDVDGLENDYFDILIRQTRQCYDQQHFGPSEDGGWNVCLDRQFEFKHPCLVYSFGIGHDFRFEKGVEEMLGCEVHAFDPSMGSVSHQYSDNGHFHDVGIDSEDTYAVNGKWRMRKLSTIMKELGHTGKTIDLLKMDVEFSEWPALYEMIRSGIIKNVRQLIMEVHTPEMDIHTHPDHECTWSVKDTYAFMLKVITELRNIGFNIFYTRTNHRTKFISKLTGKERHCCYDIHMVNLNHPANAWVPPPKHHF